MDYTGSIPYNISRSLADILAPLVGKTPYHAKNSKELVDELKSIRLDPNETMVSYDVVSLFTKTPVDQSLQVARDRLENDRKLKERTKLSVDDIMELLTFVLNTTYFSFRGQIYQQKFGVAMGSPVSPIVVRAFLQLNPINSPTQGRK